MYTCTCNYQYTCIYTCKYVHVHVHNVQVCVWGSGLAPAGVPRGLLEVKGHIVGTLFGLTP